MVASRGHVMRTGGDGYMVMMALEIPGSPRGPRIPLWGQGGFQYPRTSNGDARSSAMRTPGPLGVPEVALGIPETIMGPLRSDLEGTQQK